MIQRVLVVLLVFFVIALIAIWFIAGGYAAAKRAAGGLTNPIEFLFGISTSTENKTWLPGQPELTHGPDISQYADEANSEFATIEEYASPEEETTLDALAARVRTFGAPSPYAGEVRIIVHEAKENDAAREYIEIEVSDSAGSPVPLSGWSLQSAMSGFRVALPMGTPLFVLGVVNTLQPIYLEPSASAIITTGISPVGVSFRENICSGYLGEMQTFTPELPRDCPALRDALPMTTENLRAFGGACFDYLSALPRCHFPTSFPDELPRACRQAIADRTSYNGCIGAHQRQAAFALPSWRIYLGMRAELWYNTHDVVRLLDDQGRIVDVLTY